MENMPAVAVSQMVNGSPPSALRQTLGSEEVVDRGLIQVNPNPERVDLVSLYEPVLGKAAIDALSSQVKDLANLKVAHVNATSFGGGVAELLHRQIPLMNQLGESIGFRNDWFILNVEDPNFYEVTKRVHNALQGMSGSISASEKILYCRTLLGNYHQGKLRDYDLVVIHDPQPIGLIDMYPEHKNRWIWRCHIDTSAPNPEVWQLVRFFAKKYDVAIWTRDSFVQDLPQMKTVRIVAPSIDPLSNKNCDLDPLEVEAIFAQFGIDHRRPVMLQVSRFDPWKQPLQVIQIYKELKKELPGLQLVLAGSMATDDPEGMLYWEKSLRKAGEDPDLFILNNYHGVGGRQINAFQRGADVVLQYSSKEGFGLTVSEGMWKYQPVVGGRAGGIQDQIEDGVTGFLVSTEEEAEQMIRDLLLNFEKRQTMGIAAHESVQKHYLINREIADYFKIFQEFRSPS